MHHVRKVVGGTLALIGGGLVYATAPADSSPALTLVLSIGAAALIAFFLFLLFCKSVRWSHEAR